MSALLLLRAWRVQTTSLYAGVPVLHHGIRIAGGQPPMLARGVESLFLLAALLLLDTDPIILP